MSLDSPNHEVGAVTDESSGFAGAAALHVVFIPDRDAPRFFLWGDAATASPLGSLGVAACESLADESLEVREITGIAVPLAAALPPLAAIGGVELLEAAPSLAAWSLAAKLVLDLVARERTAPRIIRNGAKTEARSCVSLGLREDRDRFVALAKSFPLAAHAVPIASSTKRVVRIWAADDLLRAFLDIGADVLVRTAHVSAAKRGASEDSWARRLVSALGGATVKFAAEGFQERSLLDELDAWVQPAMGADMGAPRVCFRLEMPDRDTSDSSQRFTLRFLLQAADDPDLQISAADVFAARKKALARIHCAQRVAEERLLQSLSIAGRLFPPIERSLHEAKPDCVELNSEQAWKFLSEAAPALTETGMGVIVPSELTRSGQRRLRMRMRIGGRGKYSGGESKPRLSMRDALAFRWEAEIGGESLSIRQLQELAALKAPLVRYRGQWVAVDGAELEQAMRLLSRAESSLGATAALAAALGANVSSGGVSLPVEVTVEGQLARIMEQLRAPQANFQVAAPETFCGTMRPYQERGLAWLAQMAQLGLGACLADDMGLGKTIQLLAFLLHRQRTDSDDPRPVLLICPTSVIGNWRHEFAKFAPSLNVVQHYGADRARDAAALSALSSATVVLTSYGLLRRDAAVMAEADWAVIALDEAQNIKNPESRTARVARSLHADFRVALTGTPVENRLTELWSIFEFLNPGLLGPLATFRREVAIPIERFGRDDIADRLKRVVRPLLLRRVKNDPAVIQDLPQKQEMDVHCTLTREQASLYQGAVDAAMDSIEGAEGIERRGQVLALITALKQICNHPAQYLDEKGPLAQRSGKLQRLVEMLYEVGAAGERALVFTQYREMGERLVRELKHVLRTEVLFLHGGTPREQRDLLVKRFQDSGSTAKIFVLSVKAGGTGLNLTAATHVFHYDRWWNPAVEDQATDRAYRIGQQHHVQVHKFLCAGTIEEKIDAMLKSKRDLASRIVGEGEQWITELGNAELRELFALSPNAVIDSESAGESNDEFAEDPGDENGAGIAR
jgi:SNF2 family DNA or RNA helicase